MLNGYGLYQLIQNQTAAEELKPEIARIEGSKIILDAPVKQQAFAATRANWH